MSLRTKCVAAVFCLREVDTVTLRSVEQRVCVCVCVCVCVFVCVCVCVCV
jgi:hypothetical protein